MKYGGKVCTILNNVLKKVTILLLTTCTILPEPPQKSGRTLIVYCVNMLLQYVYISYTPTCYYVLCVHHDVRMYDIFMGLCTIGYEINYSILF